METKDIHLCPRCENLVSTKWVKGRKLFKNCSECGWKSDSYTPETIPIPTSRQVYVGGWNYVVYDQYGWPCFLSAKFSSEEDCIASAKKYVEKTSFVGGKEKCTAVVWPPTITVTGIVID